MSAGVLGFTGHRPFRYIWRAMFAWKAKSCQKISKSTQLKWCWKVFWNNLFWHYQGAFNVLETNNVLFKYKYSSLQRLFRRIWRKSTFIQIYAVPSMNKLRVSQSGREHVWTLLYSLMFVSVPNRDYAEWVQINMNISLTHKFMFVFNRNLMFGFAFVSDIDVNVTLG